MLCDRCTRRKTCLVHLVLGNNGRTRQKLEQLQTCEMMQAAGANGQIRKSYSLST